MVATSAESKHIFTVTHEQRDALLSRQGDDDLAAIEPTFRAIRSTFEREGFVLVRGLLDQELQRRLRDDGDVLLAKSPPNKAGPRMFTSLEFGPAFDVDRSAFREATLEGAVPALVARVLLGMDDEQRTGTDEKDRSPPTLRLLKDAFMAKGKEQGHCGWHVDDSVFWPTDSDSSGVNLWLSLDDMPSRYGGGLAVSPGSHTAEWRQKAYETIGSTPTLPPEGVTPAKLMKTFGLTCDMANLDQKLNDRIESSKLVLDYRPGDCLFCHRWLFHRSVPINEEGMGYYEDGSALRRYTVRYERGNASLVRGISLESSVLMNPENCGRTLDVVCRSDGPFYPRCWPPLDEGAKREQESGMERLARETLPVALKKKGERMKELMAMAKDAPSYSS